MGAVEYSLQYHGDGCRLRTASPGPQEDRLAAAMGRAAPRGRGPRLGAAREWMGVDLAADAFSSVSDENVPRVEFGMVPWLVGGANRSS
jgi:hypothetical protein